MPTYEYRCRDCGHSFDIVQKMSDDQVTHCPECGGELRKVFTAPAIAFKGSGFYATDHGKRRASESSEKTEKKDGEKKGDGKKGDAAASTSAETSTSSSSSSSSSSTESTKSTPPKKEPSST